MQTLENQTILILGGSSGIGLAVAQLADQAGAHVIIASRGEANRTKALATLSNRASAAFVDFSKIETIPALIETLPKLDHIVFLPAAGALQNFVDTELKSVRAHFEHSFFAAWQVIQAALPKLAAEGSIALVTGALSKAAKPACSHIIAAQWATEGLMRGLVREIAPRRINLVAPGLVDTPFWDALGPKSKAELFENTSKEIPVGAPAQPEEIAACILSTLTNRFLNGATIVNDGGWSV